MPKAPPKGLKVQIRRAFSLHIDIDIVARVESVRF